MRITTIIHRYEGKPGENKNKNSGPSAHHKRKKKEFLMTFVGQLRKKMSSASSISP